MFTIKKSRHSQYFFILTARNGETLLQSETYTRKSNCKKGIAALKKYVGNAGVKDETV